MKVLCTFVLLFSFTTIYSQAPNLIWAKQMSGAGDEAGYSIAVDANGNVYTTGKFTGSVNFDPNGGATNLTAVGGSDIFITKFDATGNLIWAKQMGGSENDQSNAIAVDANGNVYTTGFFFGTANFDPSGSYNLTAMSDPGFDNADVFISKLDANGNFVFAKQFAGLNDQSAYSLALDAADNIYIAGYFQGTVDYDPNAGVANLTSAGGRDVFVAKLDVNGNYIWAQQIGGALDDIGYDLATDANGNVYVSGGFNMTNIPSGNSFFSQDADAFVAKLNAATGAITWNKQMADASAGPNVNIAYSVEVDANGNVYTTGTFAGALDLDPGAGTDILNSVAGSNDVFVQKLDASGNLVWADQFGGTGYDEGNSIALDKDGAPYITGDFGDAVDFDPGAGNSTLTSRGSNDIFITKENTDGTFSWAESFGGADGYDLPYYIRVDNAYNIYTTGSFVDDANFDPSNSGITLSGSGGDDIFVQKLNILTTLPQTLLNFSGTLNSDQTISLQWQTVSEINVSHFEIQKSADGISYIKIDSTKASGNLSVKENYSFIDEHPFTGTNFYRLKAVDDNGKFSYSNIVLIIIANSLRPSIIIYPNPVANNLSVQLKNINEQATISIFDASGRLVSSTYNVAGSGLYNINTANLVSGSYVLIVNKLSGVESFKFIKK